MHITVVGTGYVGLVTGTCLAHVAYQVTCVDIDAAKVARMQAGEVPIYEPGLAEIFKDVLAQERLQITTDLAQGVADAEVIFLALPTPQGADGAADLSAVLKVSEQLGPLLQRYTVVVDKSTVPVGTGEQVQERIAAGAAQEFAVVSNPEFLREGLAVQDFLHPDRIVVGSDDKRALDIMRKVYTPFIDEPDQIVEMDMRSAEMTKYAANSFLAMKVSFMNEIANLSELLGADVNAVRLGIGPDPRIGRQFLRAGIGFGGSCFPKDVHALHRTALSVGYDFKLLQGLITVNELQEKRLTAKVTAFYGGDIQGKRFALWGLAFKPDTDDIREAPALSIISILLEAGAEIVAYDPEAMANAKRYFGDRPGLSFAALAEAALQQADALLVVTEWEAFRAPDFVAVKQALAAPVIFDGRNLYDLEDIKAAGFYYAGIGRPVVDGRVG